MGTLYRNKLFTLFILYICLLFWRHYCRSTVRWDVKSLLQICDRISLLGEGLRSDPSTQYSNFRQQRRSKNLEWNLKIWWRRVVSAQNCFDPFCDIKNLFTTIWLVLTLTKSSLRTIVINSIPKNDNNNVSLKWCVVHVWTHWATDDSPFAI